MNIEKQQRTYYLICYDIRLTKKRNKLSKWLSNYGVRIQKSVFEAYITKEDLDVLVSGAKQYVGEKDSLRVYALSQKAYKTKIIIGVNTQLVTDGDIVI